jgi:hypothetical protein
MMLKTLMCCTLALATTGPAANPPAPLATRQSPAASRPPNTHGRIPILEYHIIGDHESRWTVDRDHFRRSLQMLYDRGYRPVSVSQLLDHKLDLPAGLSPVVFTFDDASPSQFRYIEHDGTLEIDSTSAIGIWLAFHAAHPDWSNHAVFCMLPAAAAGHAFFGERGIEGQRSAWRFKKVQFLNQQGFELCGHTLWHANLAKYSDAVVQEQIARGELAIDSAVPGYHVRTFALPLGIWPKNRALAHAVGSTPCSRSPAAPLRARRIRRSTRNTCRVSRSIRKRWSTPWTRWTRKTPGTCPAAHDPEDRDGTRPAAHRQARPFVIRGAVGPVRSFYLE